MDGRKRWDRLKSEHLILRELKKNSRRRESRRMEEGEIRHNPAT